MAANESVWYRTQQMGSDTLSAPARAWNEHADRAFDVDAMKDGVKAKEAVKLQHVDASGLSVYANNQEVTNMGDLVANLPGEGEADRLLGGIAGESSQDCLRGFCTGKGLLTVLSRPPASTRAACRTASPSTSPGLLTHEYTLLGLRGSNLRRAP